jgi:multidrug efflux pump subunit AcrA (membrane-fusion protein)
MKRRVAIFKYGCATDICCKYPSARALVGLQPTMMSNNAQAGPSADAHRHWTTNPLVVINQVSPIYVNFTIPQRLLPDINKYKAQGKLAVEAIIPKEENRPEQGELTFIDSGVDTTTGTVQLKGSFANNSQCLVPGEFVNIVLKLAEEKNA